MPSERETKYEDLPNWLQRLWDTNAPLARIAEQDYLAGKEELDQSHRILSEQGRRNGRLVAERDRLKAIVDADKEALELAYEYVNDGSPLPEIDDPYWRVDASLANALAMHTKE